MLITKTVDVVINSSNKKHYLDLGYNVKNKQKINIPIEDLTKGSNVFVDCICDICNKPKKVKYIRFLQNIEKYNIFSCSHKCSNIKRKKTCLEKYGVDIVSKSSEIKEKIKETCLEKYGVESFSKTEEFQEKIKKTCLEKYGDEHPQRLESIKQKSKETCLEKYGVDSPQKNKEIREKTNNTCLEKYNFKNYMETEDFKQKSEKSKIYKYGVSNLMLLDDIKNKIKQTNIDRYGVEYPYQSKEILTKMYNTNIEKYGVGNVFLNNEVREKIYNTRKNNRINDIEDLINIDYENDTYTFKCDCGKDHDFNISYNNYKNRKKYGIKICTICNDYTKNSGKEMEMINFIKENYDGEIIENSRSIISPFELDIYLPELNIAFEFNGVYWHNELYKEKNYHKNKTETCLEKGIQLIHVWEDDWNYKQDIVKSMILNKLNKSMNKIYARKTVVEEVTDNKLIRKFLIKNHIQGFVGSSIKLGLFYENELVSLMTFGKKRLFMNSKSNQGEYELLRFCNKLNTNVIGGASKLFKHFTKNYDFSEITTYADRSHSNGKLYETLGFDFISKTPPNYYYVIDGNRKHRFGFRKDVLVKEGFEPKKTEHEIMLERKIYRIFDSGSLKYKKKY